MQKFIENVIGAAVTSNLKQRRIPEDSKQINTEEASD